MKDLELLELAAKAACLREMTEWADRIKDHDSPHYGGPALHRSGIGGQGDSWNALTDDGDALRLAVQMRFNIEHMPPDAGDGPCVFVSDENHRDLAWVEFGGEEQRLPATRRAIVQAAAELQRQKETK